MDQKLAQARRQWRLSGSREDKMSFLSALHRSGQTQLLEKLSSLWDVEATRVLWDLDIEKMEEYSDHIESICQCPDCITLPQLSKRLEGEGIWKEYLTLVKQTIEADRAKFGDFFRNYCSDPLMLRNTASYEDEDIPVIDIMVQVLQFDGSLRRHTAQLLAKRILEGA